jgi:WD40 repeat protein
MGVTLSTSLPNLEHIPNSLNAAKGDPSEVWTLWTDAIAEFTHLSAYTPCGDGAPRLVAGSSGRLSVWATDDGRFLRGIKNQGVTALIAYQRSNGSPRIAAGSQKGLLRVWDGDDPMKCVHTIRTDPTDQRPVTHLAVYKDAASGATRLVWG